ncbi:hypothetical protein J2X19_001767 [Rhodoferax ferrireducens]|uniref:ATP-binding protein n=1 Tax=Rhodoferax ferrireducens TaxID=192843 RepID=A0ABU2C6Z0_9BURK|nr:ATP-binding protein [Rhodoferax ferrireducens]MDR7377109.1 hypothetical protein [Rhodoferax ferrireducens]
MDIKKHQATRIQRSFQDLPETGEHAISRPSNLSRKARMGVGLPKDDGWQALLQSKRVLIVAEAGMGKTFECRAERDALWKAGEAAFFFELAELAVQKPADLLDSAEEARFEAWRSSDSGMATIFLDSIDELKLTHKSFETALKRLERDISAQLGRVTIVLTTRPIPFELDSVRRILPVPDRPDLGASEEDFADIAMDRPSANQKVDVPPPDWRYVALLPLSDDQIREMAVAEKVQNPDALFADIMDRNAEDFARRPQDLIELCLDWNEHATVRTHLQQVEHNSRVKLAPRTEEQEKAPLTHDRAFEGASRLALATLLTRKLTLRHSAEADKGGVAGAALDPAKILTDWTADERATLLERAIFGFASYGRVRFHHRSVTEYLAAKRLDTLIGRGMSIAAAKRLLFTETAQNARVVRPTMRAVAAWLAVMQPSIFNEVCDREPELLLDAGDPASLLDGQRSAALRAYVKRYGRGGWRGLQTPSIQVHRFAASHLAPLVMELWDSGIDNQEVRGLLLELMTAIPVTAGADAAHSVLMSGTALRGDRIEALDLLVKLADPRLDQITHSMEVNPALWPNGLLRDAIPRLFPVHIGVERLCRLLGRMPVEEGSLDPLHHFWKYSIPDRPIPSNYSDALREGLTELVAGGVVWRDEWPHVTSPQPQLLKSLAAICARQIKEGVLSAAVMHSSAVALRLACHEEEYRPGEESFDNLRIAFQKLPAAQRQAAFWAGDAYCQSLHFQSDPWRRLLEATESGLVQLNSSDDEKWVLEALADPGRALTDRSVMLEAGMRMLRSRGELVGNSAALQAAIADSSALIALFDIARTPTPVSVESARLQAAQNLRRETEILRREKERGDWISFRRRVRENPAEAFSPERSEHTARAILQAMNMAAKENQHSGWSSAFVEMHFGSEVVDRLRAYMAAYWRRQNPGHPSAAVAAAGEPRFLSEAARVGLTAVMAESEDPDWAGKLNDSEARLAARLAPSELLGFPRWLDGLAIAHPEAVLAELGPLILQDLERPAKVDSHRMFVQSVGRTSAAVGEVFVPLLKGWFDANHGRVQPEDELEGVASRLRQVSQILLKFGGGDMPEHVASVAMIELSNGVAPALERIWGLLLMQLNPSAGTDWLETRLNSLPPSDSGQGVAWIALLFGDRYRNTSVDIRRPALTPSILLRLTRLAYLHVPPEGDPVHEGTFTPGLRDQAADGRGMLVNALLDLQGQGAWDVKVQLAKDLSVEPFRDRILAIALEKAAEEADQEGLTERQVAQIDIHYESPPLSREEMFTLLNDRLDDINDLLLGDCSPRAAWAGFSDEHVMRRAIARELTIASKLTYTVDQEGVTAEDKETDIRLRSTGAAIQAVIELKLGDNRPGRDLRDTIRVQLVDKYMAAEECRSGCLLVTVNATRNWDHPDTGVKLDIGGLVAMLQAEADAVNKEFLGLRRVTARVLDLRPRLGTEKAATSAKKPRGTTGKKGKGSKAVAP